MKYLIILFIITLVSCNKYTKEGCTKDKFDDEHCRKKDVLSQYDEEDDDEEPVFYEREEQMEGKDPLFQWDPVKVGHEREIDLGNGQTIKMVTAAMRPKVFVIENFLTEEECDHVVDKALHHGLASSGLHIDDKVKTSKSDTYGQARSVFGHFQHWDLNRDEKVTKHEIIKMAERNLKLYMNETDLDKMIELLKIKELDDDVITKEEFQTLNTASVSEYMKDLREEHPRFRDRFSEQIWLRQGDSADPIMKQLREKVVKLTNLPKHIVEGGEPLQVLRYQPFGHYHAHFDGQDAKEYPNYKCCHLDLESQPMNCRLCRFITIVYYLNDVEEGGETAFPVADQDDYDHEVFKQRKEDDLYNLSKFCHKASLVVKPKKRRAVMWYNHHMDKEGWLGDMDYYGLHGGCDIIKGIKWMANNWIPAPSAEYAHLTSLYYKLDTSDAA